MAKKTKSKPKTTVATVRAKAITAIKREWNKLTPEQKLKLISLLVKLI